MRRRTSITPTTHHDLDADPSVAVVEADDDEVETGPLRRCAVTRERDYRTRMIRFVVAPDRTVVPDLLARLPGRGIWLSARRDVLETARTRGAFARAAKGQVSVPAELTTLVEAGLTRRITELLGLARRAGQAVSGFQKAREWLTTGRAALVIQAMDGSPEERQRFLSGVRDIPVASPLPGAALGAVFGRDHAVHAVVAPGRLAAALEIETTRLAGVSGQVLAGASGQAKTTQTNDTGSRTGAAGTQV
jgi:predicted RNA-binding protein YlxR (DUF448 family)